MPDEHWKGFWKTLDNALNRGQIFTLLIGVFMVVMAMRLPSDILGELSKDIYYKLFGNCLTGWGFCIAALIGWLIHSKWLRGFFNKELKRVTEERNRLQSEKSGGTIESSEESE